MQSKLWRSEIEYLIQLNNLTNSSRFNSNYQVNIDLIIIIIIKHFQDLLLNSIE